MGQIFYERAASKKPVICFESTVKIFPNLTDLFLRETTFKLRECYKFIHFVMGVEKGDIKLQRVFFSKGKPIRAVDVTKVKLRLKEIGWNFIKAEQVICRLD